jgi:ABC-type Fe3+ transport system substrate-binding protein
MVMVVAAGAAASASAVFAQDRTSSAAMQDLIKGAQKEDRINILESGFNDATFLRDIENGMNAAYGTKIRISGTGGVSMSQMVTRLIQERQARQTPSTDLLYTSTRQRYTLQEAGVTDPVDWKHYDPGVRPEELTRDGSGLVLFADRVGVVYNVNSVSADQVPKTFDDLADPKYRGKLSVTPYGTGFGEAIMLFGPDHVMKVVEGMRGNVIGFAGSTEFRPIITGEFPILAFTASAAQALLEKEKGAPIDVAYPMQAYFLYSIDMLKGAEHPNASRLLVLFLRTQQGQEILWRHRRQDSPFISTSRMYQQVENSRGAGEQVLLYTEDDIVKHEAAFNKQVPAINKMFRSR